MGAAGNAYLVLYNVVQFLGWSHMLYILLPHLDTALVKGVDRGQLYADIELSLKIFQTAAVLEVVHAAVGLVKTNPMLAMFQVSSRVFVAWAILDAVPESRLCRGLPLLLIAWIVTEMIRYSFYAVGLLGTSVYLITWLRFSIAIYTVGHPLSRNVLFSFGGSAYQLGCTLAAVIALRMVEHVKNALQNKTTG